jgi:ABC-2 type transport system permease protein
VAVYKRTYKPYAGPTTHPLTRFLVLQRYASKAVFKSRLLSIGYMACFIPVFLMICAIYLDQNASILALVHQQSGFMKIDASLYLAFLTFQSVLAGVLTAFVAPSLISPDLTNGALSLYLSRPFTRAEYLLGKGAVIASLGGAITLFPALLMFCVQSSLMGWNWTIRNLYLANASIFTCLIVLAVLTLLGLAMSALVRWKIVAGGLILAVFAIGKGFGAMIDGVMRTNIGDYIDIQHLLATIATNLYGLQYQDQQDMSAFAAWVALLAICGVLVWILNRKLRVCEVA